MSYVRRWSLTTKSVVASPDFFFENFNLRESYGFPLAYVAVSAVAGAVLLGLTATVASFALGSGEPATALTAGVLFGGVGFALSLVGFAVRLLVAHLVVAVTEGGEFARTLEAFAYATVVTMGLGGVPVVGVVAPLYGYYLQFKGLQSFQGLNTGAAAGAVVVASVVSGAILTLFVVIGLPILLAVVGLAAAAAL